MIPIRLVKKIELRPRQMTFGFDDSNSLDLDFVYAFIEKEYEAQGPVALHRIQRCQGPVCGHHRNDVIFWDKRIKR